MPKSAHVFLDIEAKKSDLFQIVDIQNKNNEFKTYRMEKSSILSQARSFMPLMKEANKQLNDKLKTMEDKTELDIENTNDYEGDLIEFSLAVVDNDSIQDEDADANIHLHSFDQIQKVNEHGLLLTQKTTTYAKQCGIKVINVHDSKGESNDSSYSSSDSDSQTETESDDSETE